MQETQETRVRCLGQAVALEEGMATHSSVLAWRIPMDNGAWWALVHSIAKNHTGLKRLSMLACTDETGKPRVACRSFTKKEQGGGGYMEEKNITFK